MTQTSTLTMEQIDDGWFLAEEPLEGDYASYELVAEPEAFEASPQFSEAFAAYLEGRPQREIEPVNPTWGLKAFGSR